MTAVLADESVAFEHLDDLGPTCEIVQHDVACKERAVWIAHWSCACMNFVCEKCRPSVEEFFGGRPVRCTQHGAIVGINHWERI